MFSRSLIAKSDRIIGRSQVDRWLPSGLFLIFLSVMLISCASLKSEQILHPKKNGEVRVELNDVPFFAQDAYQCGAAALAIVLSWSGLPTDPEMLISEVYTPARKGSLQTALIGAARRHGRVAYPVSGVESMLTEVAAGHPVIILQNLGLSWYPKWHYSVVVGYDLPKGIVILHSGETPFKHLSLRIFKNTWVRSGYWGLLVLKPNQLPATAQKKTYLEAVLGLEHTHQWHAAVKGYETVLRRWSGSLPALIGLGNSLYALGDLTGAENAFRKATYLNPSSGSAFNNLAQVLWEQKRQQEALEIARKAVALGGPLSEVYQKTLEEIQFGIP